MNVTIVLLVVSLVMKGVVVADVGDTVVVGGDVGGWVVATTI